MTDRAPEPDDRPDTGGAGTAVQRLEVTRSSLRKNNPASSGHSAVVYVTKRGDYQVGAGRLTAGEVWLATPREMYLVDITPHEEVFELGLPSAEEAFTYTASVRVTWRISDPVAAVKAGKVEPREAIGRFLEEKLREVTRQFGVEDSANAERRIAHEFGDREVRMSDAVVVTRCTAVLDLDESTRKHIASRTEFARSSETERLSHEVRRLRAEHAREMQRLEQQHELELKQQRMKVYADAIREDDANVLALRLAGHKEDIQDVIELLQEQKKLSLENAKGILQMALENKAVTLTELKPLLNDASRTMLGLPKNPGSPPRVTADATRADLHDDEADLHDDEDDEDEDDGGER
ncbi:hypothetical protein [Amycolatopsis tolypomycina]|uniref:hypothetical protein n=1 Tax=Amycolatopsis tolypomycina TaxID=208445 RepID=UPI0033BC3AF7